MPESVDPSTSRLSPESLALLAAIQSLEGAGIAHEVTQRLVHLYEASLARPSPGREYLVFTIAGIYCAVPLTELQEVRLSFPPITPLPGSPPWLLGVFGAHNEPVGLVDLALYMDHEETKRTSLLAASAEAAVLLTSTEHGSLGLLVEQVGNIVWIGDEDHREPLAPALIPETLARYVLACLVVTPEQQMPPLPTLLLLDFPQLVDDLLNPANDGSTHA